jgi:hypothetical protein
MGRLVDLARTASLAVWESPARPVGSGRRWKAQSAPLGPLDRKDRTAILVRTVFLGTTGMTVLPGLQGCQEKLVRMGGTASTGCPVRWASRA